MLETDLDGLVALASLGLNDVHESAEALGLVLPRG